jgi:hypothetical protein
MPRPPRAFYHRSRISPSGGLVHRVSPRQLRLTWFGLQQPGCEGVPCRLRCSASQMRFQYWRGRRLCREGALASFCRRLAVGVNHSAKMGHEGTPMNRRMVSVGLMVKPQGSTGACARFSGTVCASSQVKVAKGDPEALCDSRQRWNTPTYKFPAQQGWRHGVHSRSLGGMCRHLP